MEQSSRKIIEPETCWMSSNDKRRGQPSRGNRRTFGIEGVYRSGRRSWARSKKLTRHWLSFFTQFEAICSRSVADRKSMLASARPSLVVWKAPEEKKHGLREIEVGVTEGKR